MSRAGTKESHAGPWIAWYSLAGESTWVGRHQRPCVGSYTCPGSRGRECVFPEYPLATEVVVVEDGSYRLVSSSSSSMRSIAVLESPQDEGKPRQLVVSWRRATETGRTVPVQRQRVGSLLLLLQPCGPGPPRHERQSIRRDSVCVSSHYSYCFV